MLKSWLVVSKPPASSSSLLVISNPPSSPSEKHCIPSASAWDAPVSSCSSTTSMSSKSTGSVTSCGIARLVGVFRFGVVDVVPGVADSSRFRGLPLFGVSFTSPFSSFFFLGRPRFAAGFLVVTNNSRPLTFPSTNENEFLLFPGVNSWRTFSIV
jgi:hypothetical protein